jgi:proteasome lid subunit RPN8/RPN11
MRVEISSGHRQYLIESAAAAGQTEVCGLLVGRDGRVEELVPAANVAANPARSFEIDPATLLATHRTARGAGQRVIGHWHSHPNGRREPSTRDAARATEDGAIWLIVAAGDVTAWQARAGNPGPAQFVSVPLEII